MPAASARLSVTVRPPSPFRMPRMTGMDGMLRRRGAGVERLLHHGAEPVLVGVRALPGGAVRFEAVAASGDAAQHGIERMRFALAVDEDIGPFLREFARDPLIGRSVRARPWLRVARRPQPFEALTLAICAQLIDAERAAEIQRRLVAAIGRSHPRAGGDRRSLRDMPTPAILAGASPARICSWGLTGARAQALVRVAREVARGRIDLTGPDQELAWRRLRQIPGIGPWTVEKLALTGQGRGDQLPAGDLMYLKIVGRILAGGDPRARATEEQVREHFARYGRWAGLAGVHMGGL